MRQPHWPGIATAVAILWIISNVAVLGIAGPIWRASNGASSDAWIGFPGNALSAGVALLAAVVAGIAAYWTIVPMRRQLAELARQNDFAHYERLPQRAAELMDNRILIENVTANLEVMHMSIGASDPGSIEGRQIAFDRLEQSVNVLHVSRRTLWGDENAQSLTTYFIDNTLRAVTIAREVKYVAHKPFDVNAWLEMKGKASQGGIALHARIKLEADIISSEIASLEPNILKRPTFPQLWKGEYPGPEKLAEMYAPQPLPHKQP